MENQYGRRMNKGMSRVHLHLKKRLSNNIYIDIDGWKNIISRFKELTRRKYDKTKLKNMYDSLKNEWRV
jgi:hypothetical protein